MVSSYKNKFSLKNKLCIVLGGSGLIGSETCRAFLEFNANVVCLDLIKPKIDTSKKFSFYKFDCSNLDLLEENLEKIYKEAGIPDVFANCSYPRTKNWSDSSFQKLNLKTLEENIKLNLISSTWISKLIAEKMKKNKVKGSIIHLGSIYGEKAQNLNIYKGTDMEENAIYPIIKGGIISFTKQMASVYGKNNIRVNTISPGGIEGNVAGKDSKQEKTFIENYSYNAPLKRLARKDEIGSAMVFLASEASSYITGTNLLIDGGWTSV